MGSSDALTERLASYQRDRTMNNNNNNNTKKKSDDDDDDDDDDGEYEVRVAWSSGSNTTNNSNNNNNSTNTTHCAIPLSNRSFAYLQLARALQTHNSNTNNNKSNFSSSIKSASYYVRQSIKDAEELCTLCPFWSTAYQRYSLNRNINNSNNKILID